MSDQFIGEIRNFGFNYAPQGWAQCAGQLMAISQNTALYSLLGVYFGGDGRTTFGLPNLQGQVPVHMGQGAGLSPYSIGQAAGASTVTLLFNMLPQHTHTLPASSVAGRVMVPVSGAVLGSTGTRGSIPPYSPSTDNTAMATGSVAPAGGGQPHNNLMPYLVTNFCIALQGVYPPRS